MFKTIDKLIDGFLNQTTMYRVVLDCLLVLLAEAFVLGGLKLIPYNPISLILSTIFLLIAALETNDIFAKVYKAPVNAESAIITALILALIVPPINGFHDLIFLGWAAVLAMS
ncbi:MAG TPA: oxidoreductase, partial [Patescibacteria group bacterium]